MPYDELSGGGLDFRAVDEIRVPVAAPLRTTGLLMEGIGRLDRVCDIPYTDFGRYTRFCRRKSSRQARYRRLSVNCVLSFSTTV
jgi:hypothetical protein